MDKRTETLLDHMERFEKTQIVKDVLSKKTTFEDEVNRFYDVSHMTEYGYTGFRGPPRIIEKYDLDEENIRKKGTSHNCLIDILAPFSSRRLNREKLTYGNARSAIKTWKDETVHHNRKFNAICSLVPLGALSFAGGFVSTIAHQEMHAYDVAACVLGLTAAFGALPLVLKLKLPKKTDYHKLLESAESADYFVRDSFKEYLNYRKHFRKK